jgi:hypothetical protein
VNWRCFDLDNIRSCVLVEDAMKIHLVTYATPRFRLRQLILGWSALANHVADTVTHWSPEKLLEAGFEDVFRGIKLAERGSGFWGWKPFIIESKLREVSEGDLVFYCDVGRRYPLKELTVSIAPLISWLESNKQDVVPGVLIPWKGHMAIWTKRDAFVYTDMDAPDVHAAIPIQASFSLWRASSGGRGLVSVWLSLARQRRLISDDVSICGLPELPEFHDHRHDQSLLTLCCLKDGVTGLDLGFKVPEIDSQNPSDVASLISGIGPKRSLLGYIVAVIAFFVGSVERFVRKRVSFGVAIPEPEVQRDRLV